MHRKLMKGKKLNVSFSAICLGKLKLSESTETATQSLHASRRIEFKLTGQIKQR